MPYPQFLFSESFIDERLKEIGIRDLGADRNELQYLNKWKPAQYEALWNNSSVSIIRKEWCINNEYIAIIDKYPEAFQGRNLILDDLVRAGITIHLEKK
jgi:hypothetical protein